MQKVNYKEFRKLTGIAISERMRGKMFGIDSLSTSVLTNPICQKRRACKGSVCEKCFAANTAARYSSLAKNLENNSKVLMEKALDIVPDVDGTGKRYFRFESFGDLANTTQFYNYYLIAKENPKTRFALWTKNPGIVEKAFKGFNLTKLKNLTLVLSSCLINKVDTDSTGLFDHVFTVYNKEFSEKQPKSFINCGARNCAGCGRCYTRQTAYHVNELLK